MELWPTSRHAPWAHGASSGSHAWTSHAKWSGSWPHAPWWHAPHLHASPPARPPPSTTPRRPAAPTPQPPWSPPARRLPATWARLHASRSHGSAGRTPPTPFRRPATQHAPGPASPHDASSQPSLPRRGADAPQAAHAPCTHSSRACRGAGGGPGRLDEPVWCGTRGGRTLRSSNSTHATAAHSVSRCTPPCRALPQRRHCRIPRCALPPRSVPTRCWPTCWSQPASARGTGAICVGPEGTWSLGRCCSPCR
mmetsp:Transcript_33753/g.74752  ORF Transcript_33753/g.74752 Transcript_33753/m.74752 type:complete len:252 (+) Transcript_33753:269-1024(+)